ncbi:MAG: DUF6491 family protein [Rhodanobacter sp.]
MARSVRDWITASLQTDEVLLMKMLLPALLFALTAASITAQTAPPPPSSTTVLPAADCIRTDRINDWHVVNARSAIVRTGPKNYLVTLKNDCPQLSHPPGLIFRTSPNHQGLTEGRICGSIGETVHSRGQPPCAIESVRLIDKVHYNQLSDEAKRYRKDGTMQKH